MAVVQVVKKYLDDALLPTVGFTALRNFTSFPLTEVLFGDIGAVKVIVAGMKRHPEVAKIQECGCAAIGHLLYETKCNAERLEESDGIAAVIAAMKVHPEDEGVQYAGCNALWIMCEWAEYRPLIIAAGGAVTIAKVMEKYIGYPQVRDISLGAMRRLVAQGSVA